MNSIATKWKHIAQARHLQDKCKLSAQAIVREVFKSPATLPHRS